MSLLSTGIGLVSGLNYTALVSALTAPEQSQITALQTQDQTFKTKATAVTALNAQLLALTTSASNLGTASNFNAVTVQNSDPSQLTASTTTGATAANYQFQSLRLAAAQQTISQGFANTNSQLVGAGTITISTGGQLATPTPLNVLNGGAGVQAGSIRITDRSGASASIDLSGADTVDDVISAINKTTGISVQASIQGGHLVLTDTSGRTTSNLSVTDVASGGHTAEDLGINGSVAASSLTGSTVYQATGAFTLASLNDGNQIRPAPNNQASLQIQLTDAAATTLNVTLTGAATLNDVVGDINSATGNSGKLTASVANGRIVLTDNTGGGGSHPLSVSDINGGAVAHELGLDVAASGNTITGNPLVGGIDSVLLRNLRGGQGITQLGQISLTDRSGVTATVNLSGAQSLSDVITAVNSATNTSGTHLHLSAAIDASGTGITVKDTSGATSGNLVIADVVGSSTLATQLGISVNAAQNSVASGPLGRQSVNLATSLATYGPGESAVPLGQFQITDSTGVKTVVNIDSSIKTVGDLSQNIAAATKNVVTLQLNSTGDGFQLVDQAGGSGQLTVSELGGTTAAGLHILGTGTTGLGGKSQIDSRQGTTITTKSSDTLSSLVTEINGANAGVTASIINDGSTFSPFRLLLTSNQTGAVGQFTVSDGIGLGLATQTAGQDALLKVASSASATTFIRTSSTNQFNSVFTGVNIDLNTVGSSPAQVSLVANTSQISNLVSAFVSSYNSTVTPLNTDLNYNTATKSQGTLEGDGSVLQVSSSLSNLITGLISGPPGNAVQSLTNLGITINQDGTLTLNPTALSQQLAQNPTAVSNFFLDPTNGFATQLKTTLNSFTDAKTGLLTEDASAWTASSASVEARISELQTMLTSRQTALFTNFIHLETILSNLRTQQTALSSLLGTATTSTASTSSSTPTTSTGSSTSIASGATGSTSTTG